MIIIGVFISLTALKVEERIIINVLNINGADTIKKYKKASCLISLAPLSQPGKNGAIMILIIVVINPIIKEINKACWPAICTFL